MHILPLPLQVQVLSSLLEGCSIRSTERLTGVHRDTIMRLGLRMGEKATLLHDQLFRDLNVATIEVDEMWGFVAKKQKHITKEYKDAVGLSKMTGGLLPNPEDPNIGDQYIFTALGSTSKAILAYYVGKRDDINTRIFIKDLRQRILNRPQISSDGFVSYMDAIGDVFGADVTYGQVIKHYTTNKRIEKVTKEAIYGCPEKISTTYVERSNLTFRMGVRRLARRTNAYSKKLCNHKAAISLFIAYYNFCRVHESLRVTPAMALGVMNRVWSVEDLIRREPSTAL